MTGFSASWLALREPADHRSRNPSLRARLSTELGKRIARDQVLQVTDLGCGTGSNLRALAPGLHPRQSWRLIDYDRALLAEARSQLIGWADSSHSSDDPQKVVLHKDGCEIELALEQHDLNLQLEAVLGLRADLVTAAAFFDLVSESWIERFCRVLSAMFYTVLTYDGHEQWLPEHSADAVMRQAFHAHQATDKGFGVAAGPSANDVMANALRQSGFEVERAPSPWVLSRNKDRELMSVLAQGSANAVSETGLVSASDIEGWLYARQQAHSCVVGHEDLLAIPLSA